MAWNRDKKVAGLNRLIGSPLLLTRSPMAILVCIHLYNLFTSNYVLDISFISLNYSTTHNNSVGKKISNKTDQTVSAEYPSLFSAKDHC